MAIAAAYSRASRSTEKLKFGLTISQKKPATISSKHAAKANIMATSFTKTDPE
jgi:hypothetical protein